MPTFPFNPDTVGGLKPGGSTCYRCHEPLEPGAYAYRESYSDIAEVTDHGIVYDSTGGIVVRHWCQDCWNDERGHEPATLYDVEDGDRLWEILAASEGRLVADTLPFTVGGRGWFRVVDGAVEARHAVREPLEDEAGFRHTTERTADFDAADFGRMFDDPGDIVRVYLRPLEDSPFADDGGEST